MLKLCSLSVLLCLLAPSHGTTPGTVVRVNQEALEYMCQEGKPFLLKGLMVIELPNLVGRRSILGSVLNIVGINILNVQLPHLSVKLVPKTGVQLALGSDFHIRVNLILSPLEVRVAASILLDVRVTRSPRGFPVLSVTACKSILGDVQIVLGGNNLLGWLTPIRNHIRAVLLDKMCLSVSTMILGLNAKLGTLVGLNSITPMSHLQYSMLEQPEITTDYIDLDLNAAFELMGKPIEVPSTVGSFSLPPAQQMGSEDSMVNMGIGEHVFVGLFTTLQQSGAFNLNIGGQSGSEGYHLTTSTLESAIPSIAQQYQQDASFALSLVLTTLPIVELHEGGALLRISPTVQLVVDASGPSYQTLCTLGLDISLALQVDVTVTSLQVSAALEGEIVLALESSTVEVEFGEILLELFTIPAGLHYPEKFSVNFTTRKSLVTTFHFIEWKKGRYRFPTGQKSCFYPVDANWEAGFSVYSIQSGKMPQMKTMVVSLLEASLLPRLNAHLKGGLSLPKLSNVQYVNQKTEFHEGYAQVSCDLDYVD